MKLEELAKEIGATSASGRLDQVAVDVTHDSRKCREGWIFVAVRGLRVDGHRFVKQAVGNGAIAIISELDREQATALLEGAVPAVWLRVSDARRALSQAAAAVHGHPSRSLKLVGVTGTNGKTTTAHLIDSVIKVAEGTSAIMGTISHRIGDKWVDADNTTPEGSDTQRMLAEAVRAGCRSAVMEVSSHAIELRRADDLTFAAAVFTNLTRDHLDYHQTMENYFASKKKLFDGGLGTATGASIINIDDEFGRKLVKSALGRITTYGLNAEGDVRTPGFEVTSAGLSFEATTPAGQCKIDSTLVGRPHVYNILAAIGSSLALGFSLDEISKGIRECTRVAGRFERVRFDKANEPPFSIIIDYAHTDDALRNVLQTAREVAGETGRVITVFGCGGDRDRTKRAPMGEIAGTMSDIAIVTSDNPRTESPDAIIADIEAGLEKTDRPYIKLPDRREAIYRAISEARDGDIVLIAGKGHENYQILGERKISFDDQQVAREAVRDRASEQG